MPSLGVVLVDALGAVLVLIGLPLAVRPTALSLWLTRNRPADPDGEANAAGVASVLRMVGVMLVAFGVVLAAFVNLIVYYTAHPPTA